MESQTEQVIAPLPGMARLRRSGVIQSNPKLCLACRECEVVCSLYHEGECNPDWSRIHIDANDFVQGLPEIRVCKQCDWPACYYACVDRWGADPAIVIDEVTGARCIDAAKCRGCGSCARACPLTPERPVVGHRPVGRKRVYLKCDLCASRAEGPLCVEICPGAALQYIPAEERRS